MNHEEFNETQLLTTENQLLREAIIGLANETDFLFCFSCFNYGKRGDYYATTCVRCEEWTCEDCTGIYTNSCTQNQTNSTNMSGIEYCGPCHEQIKDKDKIVQMTIVEENSEGELIPLDWNRFQSNFNDNAIDHITDMINDFFESGEYFHTGIHHLNLYKNLEGHCQVGFYFETKEEYQDIIDEDVSLDELKDDLACHLYDGIDGFHFEADSPFRNPGETDETITLHLEF